MAAHADMSSGRPVTVTHVYHHPDAAWLVEALGEDFEVEARDHPPDGREGFYLWAADERLELRHGTRRGGAWISVQELARRATGGSELVRACGASGQSAAVLDAMAGWGVDGLVLAGRGCRVTMVERHPALAALQRDLVRRSGLPGVECRIGDGYRVLEEGAWDVVYLDPLFPERRKGALPGKRMQWLAALAEPDPRPLQQWVDAARGSARHRVVLKRRRKDAAVGTPDWQILGTSVRYDVYRALTPPAAPRTGSPGR